MRLLMSTLQGWSMEEYWYYDPVPRPQEEGPCPYNFKGYMSKKRFQAITKCLTFTDAIPSCKTTTRTWKCGNEEITTTFQYAWPFDLSACGRRPQQSTTCIAIGQGYLGNKAVGVSGLKLHLGDYGDQHVPCVEILRLWH